LNAGCIVLAGGKSSRLGQDKALVELGGQTLLQRSVNNLEFLGNEIVVVAAPGQRLPEIAATSRLKIVRDITSGKGPLVGIYTGLCASAYPLSFVVACDMPFVRRALVEKILGAASGYDVVIPRRPQGLEPLHAAYAQSCIGYIETLLNVGRYKIDSLLETVKVRYLEENEIRSIDPEGMSFFNINTPADLARAVELIEERT
jgi:molybdopterin-guanine dinucleotide biosynthesis protein A